MIAYPNIDPAFFKIGTIELRWYGLMYALSFVVGYFLLVHMLRRTTRFQKMKLKDLISHLTKIYTSTVGIEYTYINNSIFILQ